MACLYEAREVLQGEFPWIKTRIVEFDERNVLGRCALGKNWISISAEMERWNDDQLRLVVWHELGHAYFNVGHDAASVIMRAKVDLNNLPSVSRMIEDLRRIKK